MPSRNCGRMEGSWSPERRRSSSAAAESSSWASRYSATCATRALLGQSSRMPVWRSTSRRRSESSCSRMLTPAINLCMDPSLGGVGSRFFCGSSSSCSLLYFSLWFSVAGGERFAGIVTGLLRDDVHFFFQRRKALHDFVNPQRHVADGFDLAARLRRKTAGFEQQEIGVAQHRGQRIVQAVAHFEHVTSEGGLAVERGAGLLGGAGAGFGARAVHSFAGGENQSFDPGAFAGKFFVIAAQDRDAGPAFAYELLGSRVLTETENRPRGGMQRLEHDREQIAPEFIDDCDVEGIDDEARP